MVHRTFLYTVTSFLIFLEVITHPLHKIWPIVIFNEHLMKFDDSWRTKNEWYHLCFIDNGRWIDMNVTIYISF